jgi:hypothetical protein
MLICVVPSWLRYRNRAAKVGTLAVWTLVIEIFTRFLEAAFPAVLHSRLHRSELAIPYSYSAT